MDSTKNIYAFINFLLLGILFLVGGYQLNQKSYRVFVMVFSILIMIWSILILVLPGPDIPTNIVAVVGIEQATVSFRGEGDSFVVTAFPSGIQKIGKTSPIIVTGLNNDTAYTFTVVARNYFGSSASSVPSNTVTPVSLPLKPTNIIAIPKNQSAIVSFTPNGTNASSFLVTSIPGGFSASGTSSPITVTGLTNGLSYTFVVKAMNSIGESGSTAQSNSVIPVPAPATPDGITAIRGNLSATISFQPSIYATSYTVISNPNGITATGSSSPIVMTGLDYGTYTFKINATNGSGTSNWSVSSNLITI